MRKVGSVLLGALLAFSLVPAPLALAEEPAGVKAVSAPLVAGTYVEHEAVAYVVDGASPRLRGADVLADAQDLMEIGAQAAAEALDGAPAPAALAARLRAATGDAGDATGGRLVLVRNESLTTEELIAALEADPRVVFAEPNGILQDVDAEDEALRDAADAVQAAIAKDLADAGGNALVGEGEFGAVGPEGSGADGAGATGPAAGFGEAGASGSSVGNPGDAPDSGNPGDSGADIVWGEDDPNGKASNLNDFVWGFNNDGRMGSVADGSAVDMRYKGWKDAMSSSSPVAGGLEEVVVAVVDAGIDERNPDLEPRLWSSQGYPELQGIPGADEHGFAINADIEAGVTSTTGIKSYHGTHVAGIIGANWDGSGISGLAPNVRLMSVRHNDTYAGIVSCLGYVATAAKAGVNVPVANHSWGLGQGQWRAIDLAVTECGKNGVVSIFASGNSSYDNDAAASTATGIADNPYVVMVDALDPTGEPSSYTQYGLTSTDVMSPGSNFLSTYGADSLGYLGEEDADAVLYESFDGKSRRSSEVAAAPEILVGGDVAVKGGGKRFDGDKALAIDYDPAAIPEDASNPSKLKTASILRADLSNVAEKPRYLSMRYAVQDEAVDAMPVVVACVKAVGGGWINLGSMQGSFGLGGGSWNGFYVDLQAAEEASAGDDDSPLRIDWENFELLVIHTVIAFDMTGGVQVTGSPVRASLVIDSVGLGSDLVPYAYMQGTSMAAPAVTGAAAVIAGQRKAEVVGDSAKSAEKLAALVCAAAEPRKAYEGLCSTQGFATVDGVNKPGPVITAVADEGGSVRIEGYFLSRDMAVTLGGTAAAVVALDDLGDGKVALTAQKPGGFMGGQVVICVQSNIASNDGAAKASHYRATLGERVDAAYYDEKDLPLPSEIDAWGSWQLVGFAGDVYCMPRFSLFDMSQTYDHMLRFDPNAQTWESVALPLDLLADAGRGAGVSDVSAATHQGELLVQLSDNSGNISFARYAADGTWALEPMDPVTSVAFPTLASDGESAFLFGGLCESEQGNVIDGNAINRVNFETGTVEQVGLMAVSCVRPQVSYGNGVFMVSGGVKRSTQAGGASGVQVVLADSDGMLVGSLLDTDELVSETGELAYASGAVAGGFMLAGPESDNGKADTYVAGDGGLKPIEAYGKRASEQVLVAPAATAYEGRFYVLAGTQNAPYRVFSATAVDTLSQPGDYVVPTPEPGPDPEPGPGSEPEPEPGLGPDANGGGSAGLAQTGDSLPVVVIAVAAVAVVAVAALAVAVIMRRRRR